MRTALQQAFARLEELHPSLFDIHTEKGRTFVNEFSKFLEVEREQMIELWNIAVTCESFEQYYNETFKSE
jgi:hypothetical protein